MNPVAIALMLTIALGFPALLYFAISRGHPDLLVALVLVFIAAFLRWRRLG
ncbi:hypothetical protein [Methylobacterium durans]|uniref:hypothetical protein n=1 Tax=Methylobacterium durans TaxID=2202825 RepID=UPI0018822F68|nr:hypothetical protein [Methylobacterium durans]